MTKMPDPKNLKVSNLTIEEIISFVGPPDGEKKLRSAVDSKFRAHHPSPEDPEAERAAIDAYEHALRLWKELVAKEEKTEPYMVRWERDPEAKINWIEYLLGLFALGVMVCAMLTVPGITVMQIVEANKIALVADFPIFGLVFGVTALAGIFASIAYRDKLGSDEARLVFDRRLLKTTVAAFLIWATTASLVAFPPTIGGTGVFTDSPSSSDWVIPQGGTDPASYEPPSVLAIPIWFLFLATTVLDLFAAPTLHNFVLSRVTPRPIRRIIGNDENDHLHGKLSVKAYVEVKQTTNSLKELRDAKERWNAALEMQQLFELARFEELAAIAKSAGDTAARKALRDALKKKPPKDDGSEADEPEES